MVKLFCFTTNLLFKGR